MGKRRFRLSHMIPNAWFYRLRDMNTAAASGTTTAAHNSKKPLSTSNQHLNNPRNSFCYTPKLHQVYNSSPNKNTIFNKPPSSKHVLGSIYIQRPDTTQSDLELFLSPTSSCYESPVLESTCTLDKLPSTYCDCGVNNASKTNVKVEFNETSYTEKGKDSSGYDFTHEIERPSTILTKSKRDTSVVLEKKNEESCSQNSMSIKTTKETRMRKTVSGVKIRLKSSKSKVCKRQVHGNNDPKNLSSNCCIIKSTFDPQKDLKESMMEMIVENNIRASKDLEKLLACYLSLNSNKYHDIIIKVFEEIWMTFDFVA